MGWGSVTMLPWARPLLDSSSITVLPPSRPLPHVSKGCQAHVTLGP